MSLLSLLAFSRKTWKRPQKSETKKNLEMAKIIFNYNLVCFSSWLALLLMSSGISIGDDKHNKLIWRRSKKNFQSAKQKKENLLKSRHESPELIDSYTTGE